MLDKVGVVAIVVACVVFIQGWLRKRLGLASLRDVAAALAREEEKTRTYVSTRRARVEELEREIQERGEADDASAAEAADRLRREFGSGGDGSGM